MSDVQQKTKSNNKPSWLYAGFKRKEFRGKLAIAITANFINRNTNAEACVEEISGVAFIFNQKFFLDLKEKTGIDLENIVYYKDDTHYFVMTAKKQSLLEKGVLKQVSVHTVVLPPSLPVLSVDLSAWICLSTLSVGLPVSGGQPNCFLVCLRLFVDLGMVLTDLGHLSTCLLV